MSARPASDSRDLHAAMRIPTSRLRALTAGVLLALGSVAAPAAAAAAQPSGEVPPPVEQPGPVPGEPVAPVVVHLPPPVHLDDGAGYLLPDHPGVTWLVDGTPVADLVAAGTARHVPGDPMGHVEITAEGLGRELAGVVLGALAAEGHVLATDDDGGTAPVRYVIDPRAAAELVLPEAFDADGTEADAVHVPEAPGQVVRDAAGEVLAPGVHLPALAYLDGTAVLELTVTAAAGHRLEAEGQPVEPLPGAGGTHVVTLLLTDAVTPPVEEPEPEPQPEPSTPPPALPPADEPSVPPALLNLDAAAPSEPMSAPAVTAPATGPASAAAAEAPAPPPEASIPREPQDLELLVILGAFFLGGLGLVLGVGRDAR
ncbi:hypothetical protein FHE66_06865 [Georgenia sp. 311]|uniref:hypothetical protein n=1 Tax=Georgenia sp. 311 TaxID=2585134 RepID=UPI0011119F4F|nr:hypothetical protein [Georgenia sp. 311]TNC18176.1 hypothetical protein FHE66_06865 [Georgenia sp. 311]